MANVIWNPGINSTNPTVEMIVTQQSQSVDGNYSVLAWSLVLHRPANVSSSASKSYSATINGVTVASGTTTIGGSGDKTIASGTTTVYHNSDGTKTGVPFSFYMDIGLTWSGSGTGNASGSGTINLTTIPRATVPTLSAGTVQIGNAVTINTPRASGSFTHKIYYRWSGGNWVLIASGVATSYAWTTPMGLCSSVPNSTSGKITIAVDTYNGSTFIGTKTINLTLTVPASVLPTVSISTAGVDLYQSRYIQGKSKVAVTLNEAGAYGSTIKSRTTTVKSGSNTISAATAAAFTSGVLTFSGTITISTTITDSRGRTASASRTITVVAYSSPRITSFSAYRANSDGSTNPQGAYVKVSGGFTISAIDNLNFKNTSLWYRKRTETTWTNLTTNTANYSGTITGIFAADINSAYEIKMVTYDNYSEYFQLSNVGTAFVLMDFHSSGTGMAIGKVAEYDNAFEVYLRSNVLKFSSIHSHDWTTAATMQGKTYLGGWHGPLSAGVSKGYMSIGATTGDQSIDFMLDGDMFVQEGVNKVWSNANCQVLSNANGVAYKFENGLLIVRHSFSHYQSAWNTWGGIFSTGFINVPNYPVAFASQPVFFLSCRANSATTFSGRNGTAPTFTNPGSVEAFRGSTFGADTLNFDILAVGRWY